MYWSPELRQWFTKKIGPIGPGRQLTQKNFCIYLADATGNESLRPDGVNASGCMNSLKSAESWAEIGSIEETRSQTLSLELANALAETGFLTIGGHRIYEVDIFLQVMRGEIDPSMGKFKPNLRCRLATYIAATVMASAKLDIYQPEVLKEFASDQWKEVDLEPNQGRLWLLVRGFVQKVNISDLSRVNVCLERWLMSYVGWDRELDFQSFESSLYNNASIISTLRSQQENQSKTA